MDIHEKTIQADLLLAGILTVPGHLTLQYDTHEVYTKIYNYDLSISDYSMIEATRPDPTVRPPSRT